MIGGKIYSLEICQHYNAPYAEKWYEHKPQKVVEIESATILWDFPNCIERTIQASKPDITIKDHKGKISELIDFTFPMSINISNNKFEKLSKYKDLQIEIERIRQLKHQ